MSADSSGATRHDCRFEAALRQVAGHRKRVALEDIWRAFRDVEPEAAATLDRRAALHRRIDELQSRGVVRLPSAKRLWDRTAQVELPRWVELVDATKEGAGDGVPARDAWAPELAFAHGVQRSTHLNVLRQVQAFLASGGRTRPLVPSRERSAEVFGDEKALDRLETGALFGPDRLSMQLLRAFKVGPPMVMERFSEGVLPTALVLENHHTYHSLCRWNRQACHYRVIGYGAGNAVLRSLSSLAEPIRELHVDRIEYFGDLDAAGLEIAHRATKHARELDLPPVHPAVDFYERLLVRGGEVTAFPGDGRMPAADVLDWLPAASRNAVCELFERRERLPQELVGWEQLAAPPVLAV